MVSKEGGKMRTLYVTDLDGTLMKNDMTISEKSVSLLNQLIGKGVLITYATARSFHSAYDITRDIGFKIPVITRNGTTFADQTLAKETETALFPEDVLRELRAKIPVIDRCGFTSAYIDGKMYKLYLDGPKSKEFRGYIDYYHSIGDSRMRMVDDAEKLFEGDISYITLISSKEELLPYYESVGSSDRWETVFQKDTYRDEYWLEICPKDSTKAKAALKLKEKLKCDRIVVFGDSKNDLPMFEVADEAVSVSNARQEVLDAADRIIGSNEEDAVAQYIQRCEDINESEIIKDAIDYVKDLFDGNSDGHGADHTMRVYHNAQMIIAEYPEADSFVTLLAALLHDADDHKLFYTENNMNARSFMQQRNFPSETAEQICRIINSVSFSHNRGRSPETIEGKIVQDADRLDAIGAIGIARTFAYGGKSGRSLSDSIKHFYDKLLLLKDELNTDTARNIAQKRHEYMQDFLKEYYTETGYELY